MTLMYVEESRSSGHAVYQQWYQGSPQISSEGSLFTEKTWGWRTGKRARSERTGIPLPQVSGDLVKDLTERKKFYGRLDENFSYTSSRKEAGYVDQRVPTSDNGHEFISIKAWLNSPQIRVTDKRQSDGKVYRDVNAVPMPVNGYPNGPDWAREVYYPFKSSIETAPSSLNRAWTDVQYQVNNRFANMIPDRGTADIGVTVLELIKGDIPTVIRNFKKVLDKEQSLAKSLGSDYLNVQFGWVPLVSDFINVVKTLTHIDHMVYARGYRRKRSWADEPVRTVTPILSVNLGGGLPRAVWSSFRTNVGEHHDLVTADYRINARVGLKLRPTAASNAFIDKAYDIARKLGVWKPSMSWDLLSWSWLVDWAVHMGSAIENSSAYALDGPWRMDYAYMTYVMRRLAWYSGVPNSGVAKRTGTSPTRDTYWEGFGPCNFTSELKCRRRITPFGLGVNLSGLNSFQFSILVALGLAKS